MQESQSINSPLRAFNAEPVLTKLDKCVELLSRKPREFDEQELEILRSFFRDFEFFKNYPFKMHDTKNLEIDHVIERCVKYMDYRVFNAKEILIERGKKSDKMYLVLAGSIAVYSPKTPQELKEQLERNKKGKKENGTTNLKNSDNQGSPDSQTSPRRSMFMLGSLAAETIDKFLVKSNVLKIKEDKKLGQGHHIGEKLLQGLQVSDLTVAAATKSHIVELSAKNYQKAMEELVRFYRGRVKLIQHSFVNSNEALLSKLALYFTEQSLKNGSVIYTEGDLSEDLFCVFSGEVKLFQKKLKNKLVNRRTFDSPIFEEFQTDALRSGDFFGEEVLFGEKTRIFSAVSTNDNTLVLRLTKDFLEKAQRSFSEPVSQLHKIMIFKREMRKKRIGPLIKKQGRDVYLLLSDFSKELTYDNAQSPTHTNRLELSATARSLGSNIKMPRLAPLTSREGRTERKNSTVTGFYNANSMDKATSSPTSRSNGMTESQNKFFRFRPTPSDRFLMKSSGSFVDLNSQQSPGKEPTNEYCLTNRIDRLLMTHHKTFDSPKSGAKSANIKPTHKQSISAQKPNENGYGKSFRSTSFSEAKNNIKLAYLPKIQPPQEETIMASPSEYRQHYTLQDQCDNLSKLSKGMNELSWAITSHVRGVMHEVQDKRRELDITASHSRTQLPTDNYEEDVSLLQYSPLKNNNYSIPNFLTEDSHSGFRHFSSRAVEEGAWNRNLGDELGIKSHKSNLSGVSPELSEACSPTSVKKNKFV